MSPAPTPPRISVVITSYNYARFVTQTVDSVLRQSLPPGDVEVIVVDDASPDDSWEVLQRYAGDPRVTLVRHTTNTGYVQAYNDGMRRARGRYVLSLDSDDLAADENALRIEADLLDVHPDAGLVCTDSVVIDEAGARLGDRRAHVPSRMERDDAFRRLLLGNFVTHSGAMVRRSCLGAVGLHDPRFVYNMDWELWLRIASVSAVLHVPRPLFAYRLHARNLHKDVDVPLGLRALREVLDHAATYSPLRDTERVIQASLARCHWMLATMHFSSGAFRPGVLEIRTALQTDPRSIATRVAATAVVHLGLRLLFGERKFAVTERWRRRLFRGRVSPPVR